jgi:tRNA dimethylallyltransferase
VGGGRAYPLLASSRRRSPDGSGVIVAIFGPTGSGKSAVAEELTRYLPGEVVSADAMQAYRGLPILTNQPNAPTRLVGIWPLTTEGSVGLYAPLAHDATDEIAAAGHVPVVAGGTGLYLRAALADLDVPPPALPGQRERFERLYESLGPDGAYAVLAERDPAAAARVHPNDRRRIVRSLELLGTGRSLRPVEDRLWVGETRHRTLLVGLEIAQPELERRIEQRTRAMFERGVEHEVARALSEPLSATAAHIIGLREVAELTREEAIAAIVRRTLRYAAYQRKWLRRLPATITMNAERSPTAVAAEILGVLDAFAGQAKRGE